MALDWTNVTVMSSQPSYVSLPRRLHSLSSLSLTVDGVVCGVFTYFERV